MAVVGRSRACAHRFGHIKSADGGVATTLCAPVTVGGVVLYVRRFNCRIAECDVGESAGGVRERGPIPIVAGRCPGTCDNTYTLSQSASGRERW